MVEEWSVPGWAVVAAAAALLALLVLLLVLAVSGARARSRARTELAAARAETDGLRERLDALERRVAAPAAPTRTEEFVITRAGEPEPELDEARRAPAVPAPLFADLVLRESVVQAASLAAGVRRALAPEVRNRIRFEVRREIRRSRKQRRADLRAARRDWEARRRGTLDEGSAA
ncbi:hypothetical protein GGQ22_20380 [Nocardioides sp. zg-579]|uniref:Uncharacterized protein n=1 Tax=Nocardioides marmotae TaxID=2663857 RepID=A0A6I3JHM6_9ACTN|nr:hypothetical protein [Nocardioides marmotae]MCR6033770.1 hypothetical protein [Gordonia jinghuaiqii]MTB97428.1 hypothetical protein [Nocardioides marmotae]QKE01752.1 hypothetical protein HPC71_12240 [Nocardioides marmotae]